jgi:hypothetical protein
MCYKFVGSTEMGKDVVSRSVDNIGGLAYASLNGCKQSWSSERVKQIMCSRHTGETWFLKMQKSATAAHRKCSLSQAKSFVAKTCTGRESLAYYAVSGCKQDWGIDVGKMCEKFNAESWFLKMQHSENILHRNCNLEDANAFVERKCDGRAKRAPSANLLIQLVAQRRSSRMDKATHGERVSMFRMTQAEHQKMFGLGDDLSTNEAMKQIFKALGIPTGLKLQVGLNHANPDKDLGRVAGFNPITTLALGHNPGWGYCVSMLDLLTFMVGGGLGTPLMAAFDYLQKYTGGYWNYPKYIKSFGKYCLSWDAVFDGDILKRKFTKASLRMVHSANLHIPGMFGLWPEIGPYQYPKSPLLSLGIQKDTEGDGIHLKWDRLRIPSSPPEVWKQIENKISRSVSYFTGGAEAGLLKGPRQVLHDNSLCSAMWTSSHCTKCRQSIWPMVTNHENIFKDAKAGRLSWHVVVNQKSEEDLIKEIGEKEGYEMCIAKEGVSHCHCGRGIMQEEVEYCNGDLVRMLIETKEKKLPLDDTEVGKIFKELLKNDGDRIEEPIYMSVMLRIGELYRQPFFKRHPRFIPQQICHEASCGCQSAMTKADAFDEEEIDRVEQKLRNQDNTRR